MMLTPVQVAACIGCQVCAQECPTNAITIQSSIQEVAYAKRGPISYLPPEAGWQPLDAYTRANPAEPGDTPWGQGRAWHVAERQATWQSWRTWLGERKEDLRAPCQAACPVGTNAGLYVSLIAQGRYEEALQVAAEPNPFPAICGRVCTAPCEEVCRRGEFDLPIAIRDLKRFATDHGTPGKRVIPLPKQVNDPLARCAVIRGEALEIADGDGQVKLAAAADLLAGRGADAATDGREGIGFGGDLERFLIAPLGDQADVEPGVGADRAGGLAGCS